MSRIGYKQSCAVQERVGPLGLFGTIPYSQSNWNFFYDMRNFAKAHNNVDTSRCEVIADGALYGVIVGTEIVGCPAATVGRLLDTALWMLFCCNKSAFCGKVVSSPCGITAAEGSSDLVACKASPFTTTLSLLTGCVPGIILGVPIGAVYGNCVFTQEAAKKNPVAAVVAERYNTAQVVANTNTTEVVQEAPQDSAQRASF